MSMTCPTVNVKDGSGGFFVINESDFNKDEFELFDAPSKSVDSDGDGKVTAKELRAALDEMGISYKHNSSKAELQAMFDNA